MATHLKEVENLLSDMTIANEQHVSKLLPTKPRPVYSMPCPNYISFSNSFLPYIVIFIGTKLINTERITQVDNSLEIRPPYRPLVYCKGTLTEHISGYVDSMKRNSFKIMPSFLKVTTDFLCKLDDNVTQ